ncbi:hypothetical protein T484DRAFT_2017586, partial [Baffinella frigidus]
MGGPGLPLVLCLLVAQPLVGWVPGLQSAHRPLPLWAGLAARASCRTCKQPASIAPSPLSRGRRAGRLRTCETFGGGVLFGTNGVALLAELGEGGAGEEGRDGDLGGGRRRRGRGTARKGLVVGESDAPDASAEDKAGAESEDDAGGFNPELIRQKTIQALDSMFAGSFLVEGSYNDILPALRRWMVSSLYGEEEAVEGADGAGGAGQGQREIDETLDRRAFGEVVQAAGGGALQEDEIDMVFNGMDSDRDGSLSLQEVVETYRRVQAEIVEEEEEALGLGGGGGAAGGAGQEGR